MNEGRLKTACLGLDEAGQKLLETVSKIDYFELQAVADKDTVLAEKTAAEYKCQWFDDYRQLIIQNQLDCLLVTAGMYSCDEYIRSAIKKKFNILKLSPPGRNFEETAEFVRLAKQQGVRFAVAEPARFAQSFMDFSQYIHNNKPLHPFLINAVCYTAGQNRPAWEKDPQFSGGGALLRGCYHIIDQIVSNFGAPEQVYCLCTNAAGEKQQRIYLTDETAVLIMKFNPGMTANIITSRQDGIGNDKELIQVHTNDKIITVASSSFSVRDSDGKAIEDSDYDYQRHICMAKVLNNFAQNILSENEHPLLSSGQSNLATMAVIEAAYLSARTGTPEEPDRIIKLAEVESEQLQIWPGH